MQTYNIETIVAQDGTVKLDNLPFRAGERVEISVRACPENEPTADGSLKETILRYDDPTEPVALEDWEAVR